MWNFSVERGQLQGKNFRSMLPDTAMKSPVIMRIKVVSGGEISDMIFSPFHLHTNRTSC